MNLLSIVDWSDWRVVAALGVTLLAGFVRGFTGFGTGMIFVPAMSAIYDPVVAIVLLFIIDAGATTPMLLPHLKAAKWREVGPISLAASIFLPLGLIFLLRVDPILTRWLLSGFVIVVVACMATGLRYQGEPGVPLSFAVGSAVGFLHGAIGLGGPLMVLFWLGGPERAARVRSNIFAFFGVFSIATLLTYWWGGLFTTGRLLAGIALLLPYAAALGLGSLLFRRVTDEGYRKAALALCAAIAVVALPIWGR